MYLAKNAMSAGLYLPTLLSGPPFLSSFLVLYCLPTHGSYLHFFEDFFGPLLHAHRRDLCRIYFKNPMPWGQCLPTSVGTIMMVFPN